MNAFELSEYIDRSPEDVFAVIADPTAAPAFLDNISKSTKLTAGPTGVGTTFRETRIMRGKQSSADLLVTAYERSSHVAISTEAEGITITYDYRLSPEGAGTRLTCSCELDASGMRTMMLPMVARIMKKEDGAHLQKLKAFLETA